MASPSLSGRNERWFDAYFNTVQVNSSAGSFCLHCGVIHVKFTSQLDVNLKKFRFILSCVSLN